MLLDFCLKDKKSRSKDKCFLSEGGSLPQYTENCKHFFRKNTCNFEKIKYNEGVETLGTPRYWVALKV